MPCLIPEILFTVGKKVIEDGDSDAVIRFTLSGKESLRAMKNVFASVTLLELYRDGYAVGWSNGCTKFKLQNDKPFCKFLMDQIGNRVETLHLDIDGINPMYQTVLGKIVANHRVSTLSVGSRCSRFLLDKFFPAFSTSLKTVTIPSSIMHNVFRDSLNLDSLIVFDSYRCDYLFFCCKTKSLESHIGTVGGGFPNFERDFFTPHLSTVKKLTFNSTANSLLLPKVFVCYGYRFPALEVIQYNHGYSKHQNFSEEHQIFHLINYLKNAITMHAAALPPKFACKLYKCNKNVKFSGFVWFKFFLYSSEYYDESNQKFSADEMKDFHCFRLNFPSKVEESRTTVLEIQVAK